MTIEENISPTLTRTNDGAPVICYGVDGQNGLVEEEKICTLLGQHSDYKNIPSVMIMKFWDGGDKSSTLTSRNAGGCQRMPDKDNFNCVIIREDNMTIVRRLTPTECERLQGFPDGWTDIGDWTDTKGKKRKTADSPRYKALGNSIALPQHYYYMQKMAEHLPEDAKLGSLFDGIGGFPLIWETIHGKGTARWASEIEEFPIAVTKERFGEE